MEIQPFGASGWVRRSLRWGVGAMSLHISRLSPHTPLSQVGLAVSAMGVGGMFVQGVLVRVINGSLGEQRTLVLAMACTSLGYAGLAAVSEV